MATYTVTQITFATYLPAGKASIQLVNTDGSGSSFTLVVPREEAITDYRVGESYELALTPVEDANETTTN